MGNKKYIYFISYAGNNSKGQFYGNGEVDMNCEITQISHIREAEKIICEQNKDNIWTTVINYKLLRVEN